MSQEQWSTVRSQIETEWDATIVPALSEYIKVPNQSPHYDAEWATNGLIDKAFAVLVDWLKVQPVAGLKYELHSEPGRTPFLIVEIPASATDHTGKTVLLYGHMDKQPPLLPWAEGLDPYTPVIRDGKLYGRGGADDGYAIFAAITAIAALQKAGIAHARAVVTIEACEESGSYDLPFYINKCKAQIGDVDLVVCLDSGASNYDQMWLTSSLRGVTGGTLTIQALKEGIHSGVGGGVVPDSFHIFRILLDRLHDAHTGSVKLKDLHVEIPEKARKGLESLRDVDFQGAFPLLPGAKFEGPQPPDNAELAVRNFWMPAVTVTGADMVPAATAGNVVRKDLVAKISVRCPPTLDANKASLAIKKELERDPPFGASVRFDGEFSGSGWAPPELKPWLETAINGASSEYFGKPAGAAGMGGSIPFMGMLGEMYPEAQFVVTGVLGPQSNAHGPNEFIHIPFAKGINFCVSRILGAHYASHK